MIIDTVGSSIDTVLAVYEYTGYVASYYDILVACDNNGAPDAKAIPKQSGRATRNTTSPADRSLPNRRPGESAGAGNVSLVGSTIGTFERMNCAGSLAEPDSSGRL